MKSNERIFLRETVRCVGGPRDGYTVTIGPEVKLKDVVRIPKVPELPAMNYDITNEPVAQMNVEWHAYILDQICKSEPSDTGRGHISVPIVRFLRYAEIDADEAIRHQFRK